MTAGPTAPYRIRPSVVRDGLAGQCGAENGPVVYARLVLASGAARGGGSKSRCGGKSDTRAVAYNTLIIKQKSALPVSETRQDKSSFRSLSGAYLPPPIAPPNGPADGHRRRPGKVCLAARKLTKVVGDGRRAAGRKTETPSQNILKGGLRCGRDSNPRPPA